MRFLLLSFRLILIIITLCLFAGAHSIHAAQVVTESFNDGSLIGDGDTDAVDWFAGSAAALSIVDDSSGLQGGNALQLLSTSGFSRATAEFSSTVSLTRDDNLLIWSLKLRLTRFSAANTGGIRFGLHHNNGSPVDATTVGNGWTTNTEG